jgi:hypothetical protein
MRTLSEWFCNNNIPHELQRKGDIECYDKFMERRPNYPKIWWHNLVLIFKQKTKEISKKYNYN